MSISCFVQGWIIVNTHKKKLYGHFYVMNIFRSLMLLALKPLLSSFALKKKVTSFLWHPA